MIIECPSVNLSRSKGESHGTEDLGILAVADRLGSCDPEPVLPLGGVIKSRFLSAAMAFLLATAGLAESAGAAASSDRTYLADGWAIQSSAKVHVPGETISSTEFKPVDWYKATVPSTVVGNLVDDGVYPDPFFGMNLRSIPGTEYPVGTNFSGKPMPANSPFKASWWYRKEFGVTPDRDGQVWLHFDGINYRANIWLNGKLVADTNRVARRLSHLHVQRHRQHPAPEAECPGRRGLPARREQTSPSPGWTGTRCLRTRTWACGAMFMSPRPVPSPCDIRRSSPRWTCRR